MVVKNAFSSAASTASSSGLNPAITIILLVYLVVLVAMVWAYVRIIRRAGYSGWWVLIGLVPLVNVVMFFVFAFKQWPAQRELAELRAWAAQSQQQPRWGTPGSGYPSGY